MVGDDAVFVTDFIHDRWDIGLICIDKLGHYSPVRSKLSYRVELIEPKEALDHGAVDSFANPSSQRVNVVGDGPKGSKMIE